jgi:GT2 family glycosyltransferase
MAGSDRPERETVRPAVEDFAAIVVSWNDAEDLYAAVSSLAAARASIPAGGPSVSLTVVVNGPTRVRPEEILARWPGATVVLNEENRGFGPAANQAAAHASAAALLFVNPDARAEGDVFTPLARGFRDHPEALALAPRMLDSAGEGKDGGRPPRLAAPGREDQFTFQLRGLPTPASDARELLLVDHLLPNNPGRRRYRYADRDRSRPFAVEQAAAAAFAVRADAFRTLRGFDERFRPAWFEDVDLCARLSPLGKILYWPDARFRHRGGISAEQLGYATFLPVYYRNALRYRRLHYGPLARAAYRVLLPAGMLLRLAVLPFRRSDPRPKGESARAYGRVLLLALGLSSPESQIPDPKSSLSP